MVLCWIALPVFAILGIFSAKYRKLTKESLECLFKTATFQKCSSGLDDRIKSQITGNLLKFSPRTAKFFYENYKVLSVIFLALLLWSAVVSVHSVYNYIEYGNCNGPNDDGFCILDPTGSNSATCSIPPASGGSTGEIVYPNVNPDRPIIGNPDAELTVIEFGCYVCPYTNKAEETVEDILDYYDGRVNVQFIAYPIPEHEFSYESSLAVLCANEQGAYEEYHRALFARNMDFDAGTFGEIASELGLDTSRFETCMNEKTYDAQIEEDKASAVAAGVKGTPTFFVGTEEIVGPKPLKTFKTVINAELKK